MNPTLAFWIAQGISIVAAILAIIMLQLKNMKVILLFQVLINLIASTNYLLLDGGSGMLLSLAAILHSAVMFIYNTKGVRPHVPVTLAFIAVYLGCAVYNMVVTRDIMEILPFIAAFCFSMALIQEKTSVFRIWSALNPVFWLPYDLYTKSFVMFFVHGGILVSSIVAMVRLDGLFRKKKSS